MNIKNMNYINFEVNNKNYSLEQFTEFGLNRLLNDFMHSKGMSEDEFFDYLKQVMHCKSFDHEGHIRVLNDNVNQSLDDICEEETKESV